MRIKVVHVLMSLYPGGAERLLADALPLFDRSQFDVKLLALGHDGPMGDSIRSSNIEVKTLAGSKMNPAFILDFISYLRDEKPDVLHTHLYWPGVLGRVIGKSLGIKTIISHEHNESEWLGRSRLLIERPTWPFANLVLSVSKKVDSSRGMTIPPTVRREVLFNGIRIDEVPYPGDAKRARMDIGIEEDSIVLGWVGRVVDDIKNLSAILNAAEKLSRDFPNLRWVLIGDGPDRKRLEQATFRRGLDGIVKWIGERSDVRNIYAAFDIFVLPSLHEGMPMVLMEAMAGGLPAIVSDAGGSPEMIEDGVTGAVFPRFNDDAFIETVKQIVSEKSKRIEMGHRARELALTKYDVRIFVKRLEDLYRELTGGR